MTGLRRLVPVFFALVFAFAAISARERRPPTRRFPLGAAVAVAILVTFALPIWGTHHGELPPRGIPSETHSHTIWELGHVH